MSSCLFFAHPHSVLEDSGELSSLCIYLRVTSWRAVCQCLPRNCSGDIDENGGFYKMYSFSNDKLVWLRVNHFNMSSEKHPISSQTYEFLCHATAGLIGEQDSKEMIKGCWAACLHPAWACWGASSSQSESVGQCILSLLRQGSSLDPECLRVSPCGCERRWCGTL